MCFSPCSNITAQGDQAVRQLCLVSNPADVEDVLSAMSSCSACWATASFPRLPNLGSSSLVDSGSNTATAMAANAEAQAPKSETQAAADRPGGASWSRIGLLELFALTATAVALVMLPSYDCLDTNHASIAVLQLCLFQAETS